jgi:hypothetical protein
LRIHNDWPDEAFDYRVPQLPSDRIGRTGAFFTEGTFNPAIGEEVYLVVLDTAFEWAPTDNLQVDLRTGLARTDHGLLAFLVWIAKDAGQVVAWFEQFLNPFQPEVVRLLSAAGQQDFFKILLLNSMTQEVWDIVQFENSYSFGSLAGAIAQAIGHEPVTDFEKAQAEFRATYPIEDLLKPDQG